MFYETLLENESLTSAPFLPIVENRDFFTNWVFFARKGSRSVPQQ
jgi:hypothetical protein